MSLGHGAADGGGGHGEGAVPDAAQHGVDGAIGEIGLGDLGGEGLGRVEKHAVSDPAGAGHGEAQADAREGVSVVALADAVALAVVYHRHHLVDVLV